MKRTAIIGFAAAIAGCGDHGERPSFSANAIDTTQTFVSTLPANAKTWKRLDLPNLPDNVRNDTLVIETTHALGDGTFVMSAHSMEDKPEGIRLYLYKPRPDSSAEVLAASKPGYDSYTMLPTYFATGDTADGVIIVANLGFKESWGQDVFWLKGRRFIDLGFLDMARRGWKTEDDSTFQWRTSIAPMVVVRGADGKFEFTFTGDSVQVYDDQRGGHEVMLPARTIGYRCTPNASTLVENGEERPVRKPA